MMRAAAVPRTEITIGRGTVAVRQDELDKLLKALAALTQEGAASIADEIGALRVAGVRIHLLPSEAEVERAPRRDRRRRADLAFPRFVARAPQSAARRRIKQAGAARSAHSIRYRFSTTSVARMPSARWFATLHQRRVPARQELEGLVDDAARLDVRPGVDARTADAAHAQIVRILAAVAKLDDRPARLDRLAREGEAELLRDDLYARRRWWRDGDHLSSAGRANASTPGSTAPASVPNHCSSRPA